MTVSARRAAKKICQLGDWSVTNMKLQKILYLIHMVYLGQHDEHLIYEEFEAWKYGPVVPSLYRDVRMFGADPIENTFIHEVSGAEDIQEGTPESKIIETGCKHLLRISAGGLVTVTHREKGAWAQSPRGRTISDEAIREEYEEYHAKKS